MELKDMVRMANQIASFFTATRPKRRMKEIADHINHFWDPRMREEFFAHLAKGGEGLDPVVIAAAAGIHPPHQAAA